MGRYKEEEASLFSEVHGNKIRGNKHRLEHGKLGLNTMENFHYVCGSCGISILGDAQNLMEQGPEQHSLTELALSRRLD